MGDGGAENEECGVRMTDYRRKKHRPALCAPHSVLCTLPIPYPLSPIPYPLHPLYLIPCHASIVSFSKAALSILMA